MIKKMGDKLWVVSLFVFVIVLAACGESTQQKASNTPVSAIKSDVTNLIKIDNVIGEGKRVQNNHRLAVHYTGWLYDKTAQDNKGKKFDSSRDRKRPFIFSLGNRDVIAGWEKGILGMNIGGKRTLIIPPELAYGAKGSGSLIPPNSTLVFDIEILQAG